MRFARLAAAACGLALISGSAEAALTFTTERTPVNGTLDRVVLYGKTDTSTGDQANIFGVDLTTSTPTPNGMKFLVDPRFGAILTSSPQFPVASTDSTVFDYRLDGTRASMLPDPAANRAEYEAGLTAWQFATAASNNVGYLADSTVNSGKGFAIIAAVVPTGSTVSFTGTGADATKAEFPIAQVNAVPEPTSLAFLGLAGVAAFGRRRRA